MTTIVTIVLENNGENAGTYSPIGFFQNFSGNINETVSRFVSWDCDIETEVPKYKLVELELPIWMNENYYLKNFIALSYARAIAYESSEDKLNINLFNEICMDRFLELPNKYQFFYGWLYHKMTDAKKSNAFLASIFYQFCEWLGNTEQNKYGLPLSTKQFEAASKYCPIYRAEKICSSKYGRSTIY